MTNEHEIDALLSRDKSASIFDGLMALPWPHGVAGSSREWDRAVASRFEAHLVARMREVIAPVAAQRRTAA